MTTLKKLKLDSDFHMPDDLTLKQKAAWAAGSIVTLHALAYRFSKMADDGITPKEVDLLLRRHVVEVRAQIGEAKDLLMQEAEKEND